MTKSKQIDIYKRQCPKSWIATKIKEINPTGGTWVWNSVLHACPASWNRGECGLFPWEQFAGSTIHVVYHEHNILLFCLYFSNLFLVLLHFWIFFLWLLMSFKPGCQRISRAIHRHCQVCCVNCNSLICPTFLFQTNGFFLSKAALPTFQLVQKALSFSLCCLSSRQV